MICEEFQENVELYALGVLESGEASALADHLATGCRNCHDALQRALNQNLAIAKCVPLVAPPARLRSRLEEAISPARSVRHQWIRWDLFAAVALVAMAIGLTLQLRLQQASKAAEAQSVEHTRLLKTLQIIRAPGTREVVFTDAKRSEVHGAVYLHQKLGVALVIDGLSNAPSGWKYESWLVPKNGAPRPVEPFQPDGSGRAVSVVPGPLDVADVGSIAVSMEPKDSQPTKPTTLVFAANI